MQQVLNATIVEPQLIADKMTATAYHIGEIPYDHDGFHVRSNERFTSRWKAYTWLGLSPMGVRRLHNELIIGIAERFKLGLDEIGVIAGHDGLRRSLDNPSATEIGVAADVFRSSANGDLVFERGIRAWFPISELAFLPFGLGFRLVGEVEVMRSGSRRRLANFKPNQALDVGERSSFHFETATSHRKFAADAPRTSRLRVQLDRKPAIAIAGAELARFYLASLGLVAQQLFLADYDFDRAIAKLVDGKRTGWVDKAAKVYQIAPVRQLGDDGAALQLAMILASEDLRTLWRDLAGNARQSLLLGGEGRLDAPAPSGTKIVVANTQSYDMPYKGRRIPTLRVTQIISDLRPCPFETLIVHIASELVAGDGEDGDPPEPTPRLQWADALRLNHQESPGRRSVKLAALGEHLFGCFPSLETVRVVREAAKQTSVTAGTSVVGERIDEVASLPPKSGSDIPQLTAQSETAPRMPRASAPKGLLGKLLDDPPSEPLIRCSVDFDELTYPLGFCAAALAHLSYTATADANNRSLSLYEFDPAWGPFGQLNKGRPRRALIDWLRSDRTTVCLIELERRTRHEKIALGLFLRSDGYPMTLRDAAAILRYVATRSQRHQGLIWRTWPPDGAFDDVRTMQVRHYSRYSTPSKFSDIISKTARALANGSTDAIASVPNQAAFFSEETGPRSV